MIDTTGHFIGKWDKQLVYDSKEEEL